jgi:hypothetical protein
MYLPQGNLMYEAQRAIVREMIAVQVNWYYYCLSIWMK